MRSYLRILSSAIMAALVGVMLFVVSASAQVQNYVSLDTDVSNAAASFASNLPAYILAGLGIFVSLVLFRFGIRLLRRWVH